ncbi:unnamed protein product [Amoebophrya sp. A120]|nr:unnamed protein product [Amoebophrya sp. A120]|eukprot:GSA120T00014157001.1
MTTNAPQTLPASGDPDSPIEIILPGAGNRNSAGGSGSSSSSPDASSTSTDAVTDNLSFLLMLVLVGCLSYCVAHAVVKGARVTTCLEEENSLRCSLADLDGRALSGSENYNRSKMNKNKSS